MEWDRGGHRNLIWYFFLNVQIIKKKKYKYLGKNMKYMLNAVLVHGMHYNKVIFLT